MIFRRIYDAADEALTGRKILYHGTSEKNLPSIYKSGLKGSYTNKNSLTNAISSDITAPKSHLKNLVYLTDSKEKRYADAFGKKRQKSIGRIAKRDPRVIPFINKGKTLRIAIPKSELAKLNRVVNPEYEEAYKHSGSRDELAKYYEKKPYKDLNAIDKREIRRSIKFLNSQAKHHYIIKGDIDPKYIKGSPTYKPHLIFR